LAILFVARKAKKGNCVLLAADRVVGSAKKIKCSIKEVAGKATGDAKLEAEGKADKIEGNDQNAVGGLKDILARALKVSSARALRRGEGAARIPASKFEIRGTRNLDFLRNLPFSLENLSGFFDSIISQMLP
jgi:uncharacterized protein YjbJ (UPF0337 family)